MGGHNICPRPAHPHPITNEVSPVILGHEFSGVIEEVGGGITDLSPGQNVCIQPTIYCNECYSCRKGLDNACVKLGFVGLTGGSPFVGPGGPMEGCLWWRSGIGGS